MEEIRLQKYMADCGVDSRRKCEQIILDGKVVERECSYIADFKYQDARTGQLVVEDTKGVKTKDYIIKRKLMLWVHGIKINEI